MTTLTGDWRSGAYGANKRAHLFVWSFSSNKHAACGAKTTAKYSHRKTTAADACRDCFRCPEYEGRADA